MIKVYPSFIEWPLYHGYYMDQNVTFGKYHSRNMRTSKMEIFRWISKLTLREKIRTKIMNTYNDDLDLCVGIVSLNKHKID